MNPEERRRFPRIEAKNLHSNIAVKKNNTESDSQTECRVINASFGGLKIETGYPIQSEYVHLGAVDSENNPLEIKGEVVHCKEVSPNMFHVGIKFIGSDVEKRKFILQLKIPFSYSQINLTMGDERLYA